MATDTAQTSTETEATVTDATATDVSKAAEKDWQAEAEKWKALSRKHEEQSKANADKASRLDELEEASKTELEKAQARADAAEKALVEAKADAERATVLGRYTLTDEDRESLAGVPLDKLDTLAARLAAPPVVAKAPSTDGQGTVGAPIDSDAEGDLDARIEEARKAGNTRKALSLTNQKLAAAAASQKG